MAVINDNNEVINIIVCNDDEPETANLITYTDLNPACIGGNYVNGYFYPPQPYPSWTRNKGNWQAPTPRPAEGFWYWNEENLMWQQLEN